MAIKGISGDIMSIISNQGDSDALQNFIDSQAATLNTDSPFALAQVQADMLAKLKQKKPVIFEYVKNASNGVIEWAKPIELYVNPNRISISTQKLKGKQVTRGGIFYNMWGDDHWTMQISGVTGLSGMKGIEQLEEAYHASGTLLRYQNYGPEKLNNGNLKDVGKFQTIDFSDPYSIVNAAVGANSTNRLDEIENEMNQKLSKMLSTYDYTKFRNIMKTLGALKNQFYNAEIASKVSELSNKLANVKDKQSIYTNVVDFFKSNGLLKTMDSSIVNNFAFEMSRNITIDESAYIDKATTRDVSSDLKSIYEVNRFLADLKETQSYDLLYSQASTEVDVNNTNSKIAYLSVKRASALAAHLKNLKDYYTREAVIRNNLTQYANDTSNSEFADLWRPRRVICYFENRAYIGHFENFSFNRDAVSNLINYEMRFVVERMIVGQPD